MTKQRKPYKTYPKEFKLEALRLMNDSNRPASEIAMELGIRRNQLYKWKEHRREPEGRWNWSRSFWFLLAVQKGQFNK